MTALAEQPVEQTTGDRDDVHATCCRDQDRALCGADRRGRPFRPIGTPITCGVCRHLVAEQFCPLFGHSGQD